MIWYIVPISMDIIAIAVVVGTIYFLRRWWRRRQEEKAPEIGGIVSAERKA